MGAIVQVLIVSYQEDISFVLPYSIVSQNRPSDPLSHQPQDSDRNQENAIRFGNMIRSTTIKLKIYIES
jgi:hypothetical protein